MADTRKIWNVKTTVVELIAADTADEAQDVLDRAIDRAGFNLFQDSGLNTQNAFESEPLGDDLEADVRAKRWPR